MAAFLTVDDVTQVFPLADGGRYIALKDIDLEIAEGEFARDVGAHTAASSGSTTRWLRMYSRRLGVFLPM